MALVKERQLTKVRQISPARIAAGVYPTEGLIGFWRFDEGTGTTAGDTSGYGNHGTISGATWIGGVVGNALSFDGVDDVVVVPHHSVFNIQSFTIIAWVFPKDFVSQVYDIIYIIDKGGTSTDYPTWGLSYGGRTGKIRVDCANSAWWTTGAYLTLDTWQHLAATWDTTTVKVYVNGVLKESSVFAGTNPYNTRKVGIGMRDPATDPRDQYHWGYIDEVAVYNRVLTDAEIAAAYAAPAVLPKVRTASAVR